MTAPRFAPSMRCPFCAERLDGFTPVDGRRCPKAGDVSLCAHCGGLLLFDGDPLALRAPSVPEAVSIMADDPRLAFKVVVVGAARGGLQIGAPPQGGRA